MEIKNYIASHWRGEQGLLRTCLLNGFVFYGLYVIALGLLSVLVTYPFISSFAHHEAASGEVNRAASKILVDKIVLGVEIGTIPTTLVYMIWACVGIFRCGLRNLRDVANETRKRVGGAMALVLDAYLVYSTIQGMTSLIGLIASGGMPQ